MTKRRPIIAAAIALATLGTGLAATGAQARRDAPSKPTTMPSPAPSVAKPRTKNAALPTTTTRPKTVTTPMPVIKPRTKNAALPATTVAPKAGPKVRTTTPATFQTRG